MKIHTYLFCEICDKNINTYNDFISTMYYEYIETTQKLFNSNRISDMRFYTHKLVSIICWLEICDEMLYYCKMLLLIDKKDIDVEKYKCYVSMIKTLDNFPLSPILLL